eukprot:CFRG6866T1
MINLNAFSLFLALAEILFCFQVCFACRLTKCGPIPDPLDIMKKFPGAYEVTEMEGQWHQVFAMDNSAGTSSQSYTEKYSIGYSHMDSSTNTNKWSVEAGASFRGASTKAGYERTVSHYNEDSWSTSVEKSLTVNVPAGATANIIQRSILSKMSWTKRVCVVAGPTLYCLKPSGDRGVEVFLGPSEIEPQSCGVCQYGSNFKDITVGFDTNCYTNAQDMTIANAFCPVYRETKLFTSLRSANQDTLYYENLTNIESLPMAILDSQDLPGRRSLNIGA